MTLNAAELATKDLFTTLKLVSRTGPVRAVDVRHLAGGAQAVAAGEYFFAAYCGALDAGLARIPALRSCGYTLERVA